MIEKPVSSEGWESAQETAEADLGENRTRERRFKSLRWAGDECAGEPRPQSREPQEEETATDCSPTLMRSKLFLSPQCVQMMGVWETSLNRV